jgi:para-aminobenzoate synthetase/4-amino-4-deoxychorismate lyase
VIEAGEVGRRRSELRVVALGPGPTPTDLVRVLADEPGLAVLTGSWAAGTVLMSRPLALSADPAVLDRQPSVDRAGGVGGGWVGWLGFDAPSRLAFHDHLLRWDGSWSFEALWSADRERQLAERLDFFRAALRAPVPAPPWKVGEFGGAEELEHLRAVERAIGLIRAGQLYQVNVCTRLGAAFQGSVPALFATAVEALEPPFGALLVGADRAVVSLSPELFLRREHREVRTSPIKGTRPRDADGARALRDSLKDAAENVMIVDLMRNDLGRVCETGTVRTRQLLDLQAHPGLWHLVSTVEGQLRADVGDAGLIAATFPPGSVTGAPKVRAIEAISTLEPAPRGVYTGAIGLVTPTAGAQWSVAIRSFELSGARIELGVGGGVTADSVPVLEWRECLQKAAPLLAAIGRELPVPAPEPTARQLAGGLIETMLAVDGVVLRLADHLARLDLSCRELYGSGLPPGARALVVSAAGPGRSALRLMVSPGLDLEITSRPAAVPSTGSDLRTVRGRSGVWRHKWADRAWLTDQEAAGLPLFLAEDGSVLETSRGNVLLLDADGGFTTAPLDDRLLPGVTRRAVLDLGRPVRLERFGVEALFDSVPFWTSSLSGLVPITSVDGRPTPRADAELADIWDSGHLASRMIVS